MIARGNEIEIVWTGPYGWPKFESANDLPDIPKHPGVYLQCVEYRGGFLVYAAGITRRTVPIRFREHTRKYMSGEYNVLDVSSMRQGVRKEVWHGWGWTTEKRTAFEERTTEIIEAVKNQLAGFRIFVAETGVAPRFLERIEAAIMMHLYRQPSPFCDIPDKGMMLAPRWPDEQPITVKNVCDATLHTLPLYLEV